jgi:Rrf2 family cysteine metabolism transcriptional repressor
MKLTNRSEYALLALIALARHYEKGFLSGDDIAEGQRIPKRFLQQILFSLKGAGLVLSVKGKAGGYALARDPQDICVAEVVRFFEGALAPTTSTSRNFYQPSPIEHERGLVRLFSEIRDCVASILEATTLADVSKRKRR